MRTGRNFDVCRSQFVECAALSPIDDGRKRRREIDALNLAPFRDTAQ
jgi:hypothetical protein